VKREQEEEPLGSEGDEEACQMHGPKPPRHWRPRKRGGKLVRQDVVRPNSLKSYEGTGQERMVKLPTGDASPGGASPSGAEGSARWS